MLSNTETLTQHATFRVELCINDLQLEGALKKGLLEDGFVSKHRGFRKGD